MAKALKQMMVAEYERELDGLDGLILIDPGPMTVETNDVAVGLDGFAEEIFVSYEGVRHHIGIQLPQSGAALDVSEEECYGAAWPLVHYTPFCDWPDTIYHGIS